jgi:biotin carboxylase
VIEELVPSVADLAAALGLPGLDPGAARRTSVDKLLMRQAVAAAGIDQPRFEIISELTEASLSAAVEHVGTPCVVKPLGGFLSFGVRKLERPEDVQDTVAEVTRSWTADVNPDLENTAGAWLLEEYVSGQMLSCEGLVQDSEIHWAPAVVEQHLGPEPHFVEEGFSIPGDFTPEQVAEIRERAGAIVHALGLDNCAFHCEMRYTDRGPLLVAIAGREPGTAVAFLGAYGVSFVQAQVDLWLGRPASLEPTQDQALAARLLYPERSGTLRRFDGIEQAQAVPGMWGFIQTTQVGEQALTYPDPPSPIAYFGAIAPTKAEAERILAEAEAQLTIEIE